MKAMQAALKRAGIKAADYRKPEQARPRVVRQVSVCEVKHRKAEVYGRHVGFKPKAQVQTLKDNVWPYIVPRKKVKRAERAKPAKPVAVKYDVTT